MMLGRETKPATVGHLPVESLACALASFGPDACLNTPSSSKRLNGATDTVTNISGGRQRFDIGGRLH